jgi:hypothetical protein
MNETLSTAKQPVKNRRRRKLILPALQLKLAVQTLFVTLPILVLNFLLCYTDVLTYQRSVVPPSDAVLIRMPSIIFHDFLISLAISIPFSLGVGVLMSFPLCGPIFRLNRFLRGLGTGRWDQTCGLRQGDYLHDFKDTVNNAVRLLAGRIYRQHKLLEEARGLLQSPDRDNERRQAVMTMIDAELAEVAGRFGEGETSAPSVEKVEAFTAT